MTPSSLRISCAWICLACFAMTFAASIGMAQTPAEPVVARVEMKLSVKGEVVDVIAKGDLLTVLEDREDKYLIQTYNGVKGVVAKVNAVRVAESTKIYSELIQENSDQGRLYTLRASAWFALGDREKALADFNKAIELGYEEPHAFSSRGLFHAALGDFEKAIADHSLAIEKQTARVDSDGEERDAVPYINRAAAYLAIGNLDAAINDYSVAIEIRPEDPVLYQQRAIAKKEAGQLDAAIADFTKTLSLEEDAIPALMGRGFVHFQKEEHEKAIADFSRTIELNPLAAVAFNNRGYNYQQLGKYQAALADYRKSVEISPDYALAFQNLAWLLALCEDESIRNTSEAVVAARKAAELSDFRNVSDLAALAAALASNGDFDEAIGWQEKVVESADETQREYTRKILERYKSGLPFDPDLADKLNEASGQ